MAGKRNDKTQRNSKSSGGLPCFVDKQLLDTLINSLQVLRGDDVQDHERREDGRDDEEAANDSFSADPADLNSILHHILTAVNDLTKSVHSMRKEICGLKDDHNKVVSVLEKKLRSTEDEMDECRQRSLKGNFIIASVPNDARGRVSLIKSDEQLAEDGETLIAHVSDLAKKKYDVDIRVGEVEACHRLPNNQVILRLWRRTQDSSWAKLAEAIKSGVNPGLNVYFNFHLTRRRVGLVYELRKMKKEKLISKFFTDENGQIAVVKSAGAGKRRLTNYSHRRGSPPITCSVAELKDLVDRDL